jgi:FecR protein
VTHSSDCGREPTLRAEIIEALDALLPRLCDDVMTLEDSRRLNQILDQSCAARQYYLKLIAVHSALVTTAGSYVRPELSNGKQHFEPLSIDHFDERPVPASVAGRSSLAYRRSRFSFLGRPSWRLVAATLCSIALVLLWTYRGAIRQNQNVGADVGRVPIIASVTSQGQQLVAKVTYLSPTVRWQEPNASYALASRIKTGQSLVLEHGQVELTYVTGAKLLLTGPAEFVVEPAGGKLRRGELVARVPAEGHGFRIETPHGQVIDLGTEFGVVVDDFGVSQVSVFEGKVETLPIGVSNLAQRIELTSGRALQLTSNAVIPMDATGRRYHHPGEDTLGDLRTSSDAAASLDDDFRSNSLSSGDWKTIGTAIPTPDGLRLGSATSEKPYLISRREFDPTRGAVTVVCDVRFVGAPDVGDASFAILTRSAQDRGKPGSDWQELLARFVRCGFKVDPDSGEGLLEAGTKYEADRELWNISWGGFSRPQPDTLYRLEIRDDGLNVEFTISLVENPSVRKTIKCRSLFRGNHNFVALEGSAKSTVIVERVKIVQDDLATIQDDQFAETSLPLPSEPVAEGAAKSAQLEKLLPANAVRVVDDDFDGGELNSAVWQVLGDVVVENGQVQLGLANAGNHIDTWKRRPYLLTKRQFDPRDGALTIIGKVTFAGNFLNGFGGSFAVMTRADDSHGNGPGWENSILQRGVRSNFWPAALGFDHSLEIFEKPNPNTISQLAADGFQIDPRSRSYYFRVMDDGRTASLTFIDAKNADVHKTISHRTGVAMPFVGHIGFESCWGSPVLLDNVRILRSERQTQNHQLGSE